MGDSIVIFGTGSGCCKMLKSFREEETMDDDRILFCVDNNQQKWGMEFEGYIVKAPDSLASESFDYILIASVYYKEIAKQLSEAYGIPYYRMLSRADYVRKKYTQKQYQKHYGKDRGPGLACPVGKIVVYTANIGGYDELEDPLYRNENIKYVCYTDDRTYHSSVWNVTYLDLQKQEEAALKVRELKFFPHKYFPEYEISVWVDSKFRICDDIRKYIEKYMGKSSMLVFPHFERDCIYDEQVECVKLDKGDPILMGGQVYQYNKEGFPRHAGLAEGGCIVRRHHDKVLQKVMGDWWEQINHFSRRDQLSLPYVCWKNQFRYDICDMDINHNPFLDVKPHIVREKRKTGEKICAAY